tara:strand:+ start:2398 stop:2610 length:213 start_codon:yes stop_codon:yes gene_type:complete
MALTLDEILTHTGKLADIGDRAKVLREEVQKAKDDDLWTKAERRRVARAALELSRELVPLAVAIGLDALD